MKKLNQNLFPFRWIIVLILFTAFSLRMYGIGWDEGAHLHPDERMLIMVTERLLIPGNTNPDFFNYGTLPLYLLAGLWKILLFFTSSSPLALFASLPPGHPLCKPPLLTCPIMSSYDGLLWLGRALSIAFDCMTTYLVYRLSLLCWPNRKIQAALATLLYSLAFFPIQNTHFFVVDVFMTFFCTFGTYWIAQYIRKDSPRFLLAAGICFGAAFASKFTAIVFFAGVITSIAVWLILRGTRPLWSLMHMLLLCFFFLLTHIICMPYAYRAAYILPHTLPFDSTRAPTTLIQDRLRLLQGPQTELTSPPSALPTQVIELATSLFSRRYILDTLEQAQMNTNAYVFPYTLQYVGTTAYIYYLQQIFLWGLGPSFSIFACLGMLSLSIEYLRHRYSSTSPAPSSPIFICLCAIPFLYFMIIGKSAVKFMRYMLPLYPLLAVYAGYGFFALLKSSRKIAQVSLFILFFLLCLWTIAQVSIYKTRHTRHAAKDWALMNIPAGSTIAFEHWDDKPIDGPQFSYVEMTNYELPDDVSKWRILQGKLQSADYLVLASNRLSAPLQRLRDCHLFSRCYPLAGAYYDDLFHGRPLLGTQIQYIKIKEFSAYPHLSFGKVQFNIPDDGADESLTVYDHPTIQIFKNVSKK